MKFDYISILASGDCPCACDFCIGKGTGHGFPTFAPMHDILSFLEENKGKTSEVSISGSSTDPLFTNSTSIECIIKAARSYKYKVVSLHTHVFNQRTKDVVSMVDELCVSINNADDLRAFKALNLKLDNVRVSSVLTSKNVEWLNSGELFKLGVDRFTIRKNVFEKDVDMGFKLPEGSLFKCKIFGNDIFMTKEGQAIALWNYSETNEKCNAKYLWADGLERNQDYWNVFYSSVLNPGVAIGDYRVFEKYGIKIKRDGK